MIQQIRENKLLTAGVILFLLLLAAAVLVPVFSPYDYFQQNAEIINQGSSFAHPFGTDKFGRDLFVRVWQGARISLLVGLGSAVINGVLGTGYGALAGLKGGKLDMFLMGVVDVVAAIPSLIYIILLTLILGAGVRSLIVGICISGWVGPARLIRAEVLKLGSAGYVQGARLSGGGSAYILIRHILPGCLGRLLISLTLLIPQAILTESFLSFIGIGIGAPAASLGSLIQEARNWVLIHPRLMGWPVLVLCLLILSVNLIGAGLETKLKRRQQ